MATFGFADPPYAGNSRLYRKHPDYAGEVNMGLLLHKLSRYDGWVLCASIKSLPHILKMCPDGVLVASWFKTLAPPLGDHFRYNYEPVIVSPLRRYGPGYVPLAMIEAPVDGYTFRDTPAEHVIGQKPRAFAHWLFALAGADPAVDELDDLFPGSGAITRAWETYSPGPTVSDGYAAYKKAQKAGAT